MTRTRGTRISGVYRLHFVGGIRWLSRRRAVYLECGGVVEEVIILFSPMVLERQEKHALPGKSSSSIGWD